MAVRNFFTQEQLDEAGVIVLLFYSLISRGERL